MCQATATAARQPLCLSVLVVDNSLTWRSWDEPDEAKAVRLAVVRARAPQFEEEMLPRMLQPHLSNFLVVIDVSIAAAVAILPRSPLLRTVTLSGIGGEACSAALVALAGIPGLTSLSIRGACSPLSALSWTTLFGSGLILDSLALGADEARLHPDLESAWSDFQDADATSFAEALAALDFCPLIKLSFSHCTQLTEVGFLELSGTRFNKVVLEPPFEEFDDDHMAFHFAFAVGAAFRFAKRYGVELQDVCYEVSCEVCSVASCVNVSIVHVQSRGSMLCLSRRRVRRPSILSSSGRHDSGIG